MKKRVLSAFIAALMVVVALCAVGIPSNAGDFSGNCGAQGDNVTWYFYPPSGSLILTGCGAMASYQNKKAPWDDFKDDIKRIDIGEGITSIYQDAFNCCNADEIELADGILNLDKYAFYGQNVRKNPDYLDEYGAFYIGNYLIDAGYEGGTTAKNNHERHYEIREGTKYVARAAFDGPYSGYGPSEGLYDTMNLAVETIVVPKSVKYIAPYVFKQCWILDTIYYEGTQEQWDAVTKKEHSLNVKYNYSGFAFDDVKEGKWFYDSVMYCKRVGLMDGVSDSAFAPDGTLTREMFVTILARVDGARLFGYTVSGFTDVSADAWYAKPVEWARQNGISAGVGDGKFGVGLPVTREQIAVFLYSYFFKIALEKKDLEAYQLDYMQKKVDLEQYTDSDDISGWAKDAVVWAMRFGLISGTSKTTISPKDHATRAQAAVIFDRFYSDIIVGCRCYY